MRQELAVQLDEFLEKGQFDDAVQGTCTDLSKRLQAECASFIETLFTVIRTKSYLPYNAVGAPSSSLDNGIPIPLDALLTSSSISPDRTRKRSNTDDDRDGRPPAKNPRLGDGPYNGYGGGDGRVGPQAPGGWTRPPYRDGGMGMGMGMNNFNNQMGMVGMNGMGPMNGRRPQGYQPPDQIKRGICRDYHSAYASISLILVLLT
jgi:RNA-binding protein 26